MSGEPHADEPTSLIDEFMAEYDVQDVTCAVVDVGPERIYKSLRGYDLATDPVAGALFGLRTVLDRVADALRRRTWITEQQPHLTIEDVVALGTGFVLLGERPGREFAVGSVGRFWQPRIVFAKVAPPDFTTFAQRGYAKLAWSARVLPYGRSQAIVLIDVRVKAFDRAALTRFARYWTFIGPLSRLIRRRAIARATACAQSFFMTRSVS
ncbi:MAG TPA: hypothetical protein VMA36_01430 [Candidatus Limnocylindria bacterium]|nr:hypothetical protein [Candidatus Limnocylindria bacterium]